MSFPRQIVARFQSPLASGRGCPFQWVSGFSLITGSNPLERSGSRYLEMISTPSPGSNTGRNRPIGLPADDVFSRSPPGSCRSFRDLPTKLIPPYLCFPDQQVRKVFMGSCAGNHNRNHGTLAEFVLCFRALVGLFERFRSREEALE